MNKKFVFLSSIIFALAILVFPRGSAMAATFYMATTGNDATGNGAVSSPFLTLQQAFTRMSGGDTLIIEDGTYTGSANAIDVNHLPPDGSPAAWTVIKARNDGAVIFDGQNSRMMFGIYYPSYVQGSANALDFNWGTHNRYWQFEGLIWGRNTDANVQVMFSSYIKFLRDGFFDVGDGNRTNVNIGYHSNYVLVEGSYSYGTGRYKFIGYQSRNHVYRNCVARVDGANPLGEVLAGISMYSMWDTEVQNCIVIDGDQSQAWSNVGIYAGSFAVPSTDMNAQRINFTNIIALNNKMGGLITTGNGAYSASDMTFTNCVVWNTTTPSSYSINWWRGNNNTINHCNFGVGVSDYWPFNSYNGVNNNTTLKNSILYNYTGQTGLVYSIENFIYNALYSNNPTTYFDTTPLNSQTTLNPIYNASTNPTGALKYITRIESGSNLTGRGENGADIGANIKTLIGTPGTLYGETGYNTDTGVSMWPFPNENLIKSKMKAYSGGGVSGNRGFAADGNGLYGGPITLTSYIWEYLGNPCPSDICNYTQTFSPADTNQNNLIEMRELMVFVGKWKSAQAILNDVLTALDRWLKGM